MPRVESRRAGTEPVDVGHVPRTAPDGAEAVLRPFRAGANETLAIHGFRAVRLAADIAPPVATLRDPFGVIADRRLNCHGPRSTCRYPDP